MMNILEGLTAFKNTGVAVSGLKDGSCTIPASRNCASTEALTSDSESESESISIFSVVGCRGISSGEVMSVD